MIPRRAESQAAFQKRAVVRVLRELIGAWGFHCMTQQQPVAQRRRPKTSSVAMAAQRQFSRPALLDNEHADVCARWSSEMIMPLSARMIAG